MLAISVVQIPTCSHLSFYPDREPQRYIVDDESLLLELLSLLSACS